MRTPNSEQFWTEETEFCEQEGGRKTQRIGGFEVYCRMQANFAWEDGFPELARRIAKAGGFDINEESHQRWLKTIR